MMFGMVKMRSVETGPTCAPSSGFGSETESEVTSVLGTGSDVTRQSYIRLQSGHGYPNDQVRDVTTIFSRIISGQIPGTFVHRDDLCVAFMSINPMAVGHALVVPIEEVDHWVDCAPELSAHLFSISHRIGLAQRNAFDCDRVGLIIAGYEVPHAHIHLIPTTNMGQLSFANAAASVDPADLEAAAASIRAALSAL